MAAPLVAPAVTSAATTKAKKRPSPISFTAKLGSEARRGGNGSLSLRIAINPKRLDATMTQLRVYTPSALDLALSGLGLDECSVARERFAEVMVSTPTPVTCPGNALIATGSARAELRFSTDEVITAEGSVGLYAGANQSSDPGLVTIVESRHPVATQLLYSGTLFDAPRPYGIGIQIRTPPLPAMPLDATTAITRMSLTIGSPSIVYTRRDNGYDVRYQPASIPIPRSCPKRGFRFWAELRFRDAPRRTAVAYAPCPRRSPRG
ncbi:MAG: hypothetical protein ITG02_07745 [Patulibacter sp.]|nr:hypothetical protein [Patulibacter sp.]